MQKIFPQNISQSTTAATKLKMKDPEGKMPNKFMHAEKLNQGAEKSQ